MKTYKVNPVAVKAPSRCGLDNNIAWEKAEVLCDFNSPWDKSAVNKIEFRVLYSKTHLYFSFKVFDNAVYVDRLDDTYNSINNSDRVELFFRSDKNLNPYYCLEIDPTPRIMDFRAKSDKNFDFNWHWPAKDIVVESVKTENYFKVEGAISLSSLKTFKLLNDGIIQTGLYRAKYRKQADGSYKPTWITWVDPKTESPDFHNASSFGVLKLE
ncbi:carbohydrate-binding family 9-like protein [Oceanihabitans sp. IOP_32]|uniref:carbohydrate-binding family 9-like protein n=1 Tax=Oceanihabitans sp. IOP_32 TaxID=2529032 RepID=UPI0018849788|nr:carbohydrate-binding family 9-like protein [Oceanihabitans sp. IOP_32]